MSTLRALGRLVAAGALIAGSAAAQVLVAGPLLKNYTAVPDFFFRNMRRVLGLQVAFNGAAVKDKPAIYVANHKSYLDILILGSQLSGAFVAKSKIGEWPLFGPAGRAARMIFIERTRDFLPQAQAQIAEALQEGRSVIFFPEGKTTKGENVLQFKAGLLSFLFNDESQPGSVEAPLENVPVQPMAIKLLKVEDRPVDQNPSLREFFDWEHESFLSHAWRLMHAKSIQVELTALTPLTPPDFPGPRELMNTARQLVADIVAPGMPEPPPHRLPA